MGLEHIPLNQVPWDGFHDLTHDAELYGMVSAMLERGERVAIVQVKPGEWQVGWRHRNGRFGDTWGLPLPSARRALEDATSRFFKRIKGMDHAWHSHHPPRMVLPTGTWKAGGDLLTAQSVGTNADFRNVEQKSSHEPASLQRAPKSPSNRSA